MTRKISFSADERTLELSYNVESGFITVKELIEGEPQEITSSLVELKTIMTFIKQLEQEKERMQNIEKIPFPLAM